MSLTTDQARTLAGSGGNVVSTDGGKIGGIGQIYLDDATGDPTWVTAKTGLFGTKESFVPLEGARVDGDDVVVGYDKSKVTDAPRVDPDGNLSPEEEDQLYAYYGLGSGSTGAGYADSTSGTQSGTGTETGIASGYVENASDADYSETATTGGTGAGTGFAAGTGTTTGTDRDDDLGTTTATDRDLDDDRTRGAVGHDTSGPTTDEAMTRSEEQVTVGTTQRETGRARLRKYVVTENVTQTVPVSHEEVRLEREPITEGNRGEAYDGPAISEEEHEVVLHAEQPVVQKEAVPVERVRLDKETVTDTETVSEDVRKEQIELEDDGDTKR
ncbi:YsnF/AvaK domain-containing protein [Microlunatus capsulatus]|uniref:Uncharacterized protein (TIGR02271 family) n=1 Tax=Microlunatus capsulatus TaxID=99117 RepID=A0ABS4Z5Q7_9ACTN|nr:YsnF/AvaK domain-containing protein [Microlunatus capsulatus]MBP2416314.1 uncharacterized protein (TIGR02271 family) [Microlunatus capsulatus]